MTQDANSTQGQNPQAHPCQPSQNPSNPSGGFVKGIAIALVTQNEDPEGLCRVKVRYPWHGKPADSYWARLTMPMAGKDRGLVLIPEVGDEVVVGFEREDLRFPYVLGAVERTGQAAHRQRRRQERQAHPEVAQETLPAIR